VSPHPSEPLELLLVDDCDDDVLMFQDALADAQRLRMTVVKDGEEALAYVQREGKYKDARPPSLLLLDIKMPKKDGLEVLKTIKENPSLSHLPIVVLTGSSREEDVARSYAAGAAAYITKPVGLTKWQEMVERFVVYWTQVVRVPAGRG
jgi:CheY-like chemotaxis protein